ncbi:hypothetical protein F8C14_27790, partial [Escherichia coli]|nr:hypothetical protein [Escherichia coli]
FVIEYACFSKSMTILRQRGLSLCVTQMNLRATNVRQSMGFRGCGRRSIARIRRAPTALSWRRAS